MGKIYKRDFMLDYVTNVLEYAMDFSWLAAKASHAVLLCHMEQGEIEGWHQVDKIHKMRHAHAQIHTGGQVQNMAQ